MRETRKDAATCAHDWVPFVGGEVCYGCNQIRRYDSVTYTAPEPLPAPLASPRERETDGVRDDAANEMLGVLEAYAAKLDKRASSARGIGGQVVGMGPGGEDGRLVEALMFATQKLRALLASSLAMGTGEQVFYVRQCSVCKTMVKGETIEALEGPCPDGCSAPLARPAETENAGLTHSGPCAACGQTIPATPAETAPVASKPWGWAWRVVFKSGNPAPLDWHFTDDPAMSEAVPKLSDVGDATIECVTLHTSPSAPHEPSAEPTEEQVRTPICGTCGFMGGMHASYCAALRASGGR